MAQGFGQGFGRVSEPAQGVNPGRGLVYVLDYAVASHRRAVGLLILACALFFLPGFFNIPPVDRDEARFAQATRQMLETRDFIDIRFQDEVRYKKPVGIYWLQAATVSAGQAIGVSRAEQRIALYRIPSLIGAIGAVLLTYWTALAFVTRRGAMLAALMMCSSILLGVEARLAKTDAMLLLASVAAMGAMARVYLSWQRAEDDARRPWLLAGIFWTALAAGILIKGPLILMLVGLPLIPLWIMDRSAAWFLRLRPLAGIPWMLLLVLPWFVLIVLRSGDSFFAGSLGQDLFGKVVSGQESHGAPPGLYFLLFWVTFWPGAVLAGLAAPAVWRARREPGAQFLLAWLIPSWIVFELVMTKLPHYVLPLYPAIAILIVGVMERRMLARNEWLTRGTMWWFVLPAILAVAAVIVAVMVMRQPVFVAWPFLAAAAILGLFAWWLYDDNRAERSLLNAAAASFFLALGIYGVLLPTLRPLFPAVSLARVLRESDCNAPVAAAAGFVEPSLVFLTSTRTRLLDGSSSADFLRQGPCRYALIEFSQQRAFVQRADAIGLRYSRVGFVDGYNHSQGRDISVTIFRSEGSQ
jgi:4-amino-4-deoxy-L-arabinose transferase-like glycosyltransferase